VTRNSNLLKKKLDFKQQDIRLKKIEQINPDDEVAVTVMTMDVADFEGIGH
jgi:hypothetical protein